MKKNIQNILVIGATNSPTNVDLTNSIYRTCRIINKLNFKVTLLTENPISILTRSNSLENLVIKQITSVTVNEVIKDYNIDAVIPTLGDRNALSIISQNSFPSNVEILGVNTLAALATINRDALSNHLEYNNLPVINYISTKNENDIYDFVRKNEFPVIVRRRFKNHLSSGWTIIENLYDLNNFIEHDPEFEDAVEIEKSVHGQREFSVTTLRDKSNNVNVVGAIEDIQPIGIHHLDSLLVTPTLTLSNSQIQELRKAAIKVTKAFNIVGVCTTHFALNLNNPNEFYITEIIPRLSEETKFLETAYNYQVAEIAAQLNVGMNIDKLENLNGEKVNAAYEPNIEFLTMRVPTWSNIQEIPLEPKKTSNGAFIVRSNNIEEILKKGQLNAKISQTNALNSGNLKNLNDDELFEKIIHPTNRQLSVLKIALNRGFDVPYLSKVTKIHPVYLESLRRLSKIKLKLVQNKGDIEILRTALVCGFSIDEISTLWKISSNQLKELISQSDIKFQLKDAAFVTNNTKSLEYIPSIGKHNEFTYNDQKETIVIKASPEMSFEEQVRNNFLISRIAQISHKNGFNAILIDKTTRETINIDESKISRIVDPFDEIDKYNLLSKNIFKHTIKLTNDYSDKNGLLDEGETKIFEDNNIKSNDEYELSVLKDTSNWLFTSYVKKNVTDGSFIAGSIIDKASNLKELVDNFLKYNLTNDQKKYAKLLNFTVCFINDEVKIKKVSIGFNDNIIIHDIVSSLNLIDTYVKLVIGIDFNQLNLDINEEKFITSNKKKSICFKNNSFTIQI
ncbi:ATP-binding protein [Companilactobacillus sp. DQM5]|uniref:ATP-binding protein n=1 Tax=Companilactobacillus sp. DQM5 TaxID=3463359 RepID=UPI004057CC1D